MILARHYIRNIPYSHILAIVGKGICQSPPPAPCTIPPSLREFPPCLINVSSFDFLLIHLVNYLLDFLKKCVSFDATLFTMLFIFYFKKKFPGKEKYHKTPSCLSVLAVAATTVGLLYVGLISS